MSTTFTTKLTNAEVAHRLRQVGVVMREHEPDADPPSVEIDDLLGACFNLAADQIEHGQVSGWYHKQLLTLYVKMGVIAERLAREEGETQ